MRGKGGQTRVIVGWNCGGIDSFVLLKKQERAKKKSDGGRIWRLSVENIKRPNAK